MSPPPTRSAYLRSVHVVEGYMRPFFVQTWSLFAPNPLAVDRGVLIRARVVTRADTCCRTTGFVDATTPELQERHENRFFGSRRPRVALSAISALATSNLRSRPRPRKGQRRAADGRAAVSALMLLQGYATAVATGEWGSRVRAVQVRIVASEFPRFSQRHRSDHVGHVTFQDLPWVRPLTVDM